jgi:large subunit ribosomal protein L21
MYAIVEVGGKQYKVEPGCTIDVEKMDVEPGTETQLKDVLMVAKDDKEIILGDALKNAKVIASVQKQFKGRKIVIMKFKRRKNYRRKIGHRQKLTKLLIKDIVV